MEDIRMSEKERRRLGVMERVEAGDRFESKAQHPIPERNGVILSRAYVITVGRIPFNLHVPVAGAMDSFQGHFKAIPAKDDRTAPNLHISPCVFEERYDRLDSVCFYCSRYLNKIGAVNCPLPPTMDSQYCPRDPDSSKKIAFGRKSTLRNDLPQSFSMMYDQAHVQQLFA